jgi:hypothetical protein
MLQADRKIKGLSNVTVVVILTGFDQLKNSQGEAEWGFLLVKMSEYDHMVFYCHALDNPFLPRPFVKQNIQSTISLKSSQATAVSLLSL